MVPSYIGAHPPCILLWSSAQSIDKGAQQATCCQVDEKHTFWIKEGQPLLLVERWRPWGVPS